MGLTDAVTVAIEDPALDIQTNTANVGTSAPYLIGPTKISSLEYNALGAHTSGGSIITIVGQHFFVPEAFNISKVHCSFSFSIHFRTFMLRFVLREPGLLFCLGSSVQRS